LPKIVTKLLTWIGEGASIRGHRPFLGGKLLTTHRGSMKKLTIGIIFGGKSAEHEVSLQSAKNVYGAIDKEKYQPLLIGIDKEGRWLLADEARFLINDGDPRLIGLQHSDARVTLAPECRGALSSLVTGRSGPAIDVAFPLLHGPMGEDGTVQGLLKLAGIPFVGSGILGSAVGMDKEVMKRLLRDAGIPIARFRNLRDGETIPDFAEVVADLGLPLFVKPANMGSSVGVSKVTDEAGYVRAVEEAFAFDLKVIVEEMVAGREIECSVLGNSRPIASGIGEIKANHDFYSYEAKYIDENGAALEIPAQLPPEVVEAARQLAIATFTTLCCEGLGRVDMFLRPDGELVVNEINTMPGFTRISMYPKLWEAAGIPYTELIDRLITLAINRFEREQRLRTNYL
jgi:D-alanine-D-alanine ligase